MLCAVVEEVGKSQLPNKSETGEGRRVEELALRVAHGYESMDWVPEGSARH